MKKFIVGTVFLWALGALTINASAGQASDRPVNILLESSPRHERLSVRWRRMVDYVVFHNGTQLSIVFDSASPLSGQSSIAKTSKWIDTAVQHRYEDKTELLLALKPGTRVRHYRIGLEVIIDVLSPRPLLPASTVSTAAAVELTGPSAPAPAGTN